jgi:predicted Rossmann fold nucleotide-binding protein DprA/Smf involved in DNA uptake
VTGTRKPLTAQQSACLVQWIHDLQGKDVTLHHGDCVGADQYAHALALAHGLYIEIHPPKQVQHRAFCKGDVVHETKEYLVRDQDIVDAVTLLVALPEGPERLRSGTWATVRMARKAGKPVNIIWPNGFVTMEHNGE